MVPGAHEQLLGGTGGLARGFSPQAMEVLQRPTDEDGVPAAGVQRGHVDARLVLIDAPPAPVVIVTRVIDPVEKVPSETRPDERRVFLERQVSVVAGGAQERG